MMIDVLALGGDEAVVGDRVAFVAAILERQVLHREVHARKVASRHRKIARLPRAGGQQDSVPFGSQPIDRQVASDIDSASERHAFRFQNREPAVQDPLLHLELGDAVAQQPADSIGFLEHGHRMSHAIELVGRGQPGGTGPDNRDLLSGPMLRAAAARPSLRRTHDR